MIIISTSLSVPTQPSPRFHVEAWLPFKGDLSGTVKWTIVFCTHCNRKRGCFVPFDVRQNNSKDIV